MKKLIRIWMTAVFVILLSSFGVHAQSDEAFIEVEPVKYAETYVDSSVSLFGATRTLEEVITEAWENMEKRVSLEEFNIPVDETDEIVQLYRSIIYRNPKKYYYVDTGLQCGYNPITGMITSVLPKYVETDKTVIAETIASLDVATEEIMMYLSEDMTDFEKVMAVHDYMVLNYEYDYTYSNYSISIMTTKKGVCMSYALAFKHLMNELGIECQYVSSEAIDHAWNLVKVDGEWYHIDLTWDDPGVAYAQVRHTYALLSDQEIQSLEKPHYGYDLNGLEANSDKYDKATWHKGVGAIATVNGVTYYVDGNKLVDQNGKMIFQGLDGNKGFWSIGDGYVFYDTILTGVAEYNGLLFFNTDRAIYAYSPAKEKILKVADISGVCGLFVDKNTLKYCVRDTVNKKFIEGGSLLLGKIRFGGTFHQDSSIIKRIYKEENADEIWVFADDADCVQMEKITQAGMSKISFDSADCQTLYFWNDNLMPLKSKEVYNR